MRRDLAFQRRVGEVVKRIKEMLVRTDVRVIPSFDSSGTDDNTAPALDGPDSKCSGAHCRLVVRFKTARSPFRKTNTLCTGINWRLFDRYRDLQEETGAEVYILFVHFDTGEMRGDVIASLERYVHHEYDGPDMGPGGMLFWEYDLLPRWGSLEVIDNPFARSPARLSAPRVRRHKESPLKGQVKLWPKPPDVRQTNFLDVLEPSKASAGGRR